MQSPEAIDLDFQKLWCVVKRRWLPATGAFSGVMAIAIVVASLQKPGFEAQGKLLVKKTNQTSALTGLGEQIGHLEGLDLKSSPISTELEVVRSIPILQQTITALHLKDKKGEILKPEVFAKQIKLKAIPSTDVLQLSYENKNPLQAEAVVDKIMSLYIENDVLTNRATAVAAGEFIAKQLPEIEANVHEAELSVLRFKEKNQVVALDEESRDAVATIKELESKITETQAALAEANTRSINLKQKVGTNSLQATQTDSLNRSTGVQKVLEELQTVESQLAVEQTHFLPTHPTIQNLNNKRSALKALLQQRIEESVGDRKVPIGNLQTGQVKQQLIADLLKSEVERQALFSRLELLSKTKAIYRQRINILPKLAQEQRELERKLEVAQSTYQTLSKKLQEVRVAENQNVGNARIIEPALVSEKSAIVQKMIFLVLGNLLGIFFATGTIVFLEVRDRSIKRLKEAKELFGYTLLGVIPSSSKKAAYRRKNADVSLPELPVRDTPRLPIAQAYQMLQANLKFINSDRPLSVIVVTSSVPVEGKSTISANLAAAMAQLGRRVLLVDADMHNSIQHHIWNLTNVAGLSDAIVGQAELSAAVKEAMPNLDVLTAGVIPPNPLALLDSKRMAALIEHFRATYDFVIIDAPPLALGADALTLGKITDGVLLVARPGVVSYAGATAAKESLLRSGQNVLGLVVNGVILENESDSYFYYTSEYSAKSIPEQKSHSNLS